MRTLVIGIDSGTQSTKALVVDAKSGKALGSGSAAYGLIPNLPPGSKEQNPSTWVRATRKAIVDALKLRLVNSSEQLVVPVKNLEAYNLYLKGRFFYHKFTEPGLRKSLDFYQHVLLQDPGFARAYAGIADCWCQLADDWIAPEEAYPRAKAASKPVTPENSV